MDQPRDRPPVSKDDGDWLEVDGLTPVEDEDDDSWQEQCDFLMEGIRQTIKADGGPTAWQKLVAEQKRADHEESDHD